MKENKVVVIGSTNTDMVVQTDRLPSPGETVLGRELIMASGGKGANQAVAAARLNAPVIFIAKVGTDMFGRKVRESLKQEGLDTDYILVDPDTPSGVALIVVDSKGQNQITVAPGANHKLAPEDLDRFDSAFQKGNVLLLQLETPIETVLKAAQKGRERGCTVILNPAPAPDKGLPEDIYGHIDYITPNEHEAKILSGKESPEEAGAALLEKGVGGVIITLGEQGSLTITGSGSFRRPTLKVKAVDATAAGDSFNGAFAAALLEDRPLQEAIGFAHAAAALSVQKMGAQPSLPTREEVAEALK